MLCGYCKPPLGTRQFGPELSPRFPTSNLSSSSPPAQTPEPISQQPTRAYTPGQATRSIRSQCTDRRCDRWKAMSETIPPVNEQTIAARVSPRSLRLARSYLENDAVFDLRRQGGSLRALVPVFLQGQQDGLLQAGGGPTPYSQRIRHVDSCVLTPCTSTPAKPRVIPEMVKQAAISPLDLSRTR